MTQVSDLNKKKERTAVSAVVSPCSARKAKLSSSALCATSLPEGPQAKVGASWLKRLEKAPRSGRFTPRELYVGVAIQRIQAAAERLTSPMFVISAGLGLIAGSARVPPYDLTLSPTAASPLSRHTVDTFQPAAWWALIQQGPFASPLSALAEDEGRVLIALTKPYASLVGEALATSPEDLRKRLRLFGAGLQQHLPTRLHDMVMPYDRRLDVLIPGTRYDFSARALDHFSRLIASTPMEDTSVDSQHVEQVLRHAAAPVSAKRPRASDEEIKRYIGTLLSRGLSSSKALFHLRNEHQVACEQSRFRRLYEEAST